MTIKLEQQKTKQKNHNGLSFVIGRPIGHSLSPLLHNYWLKLYGLRGHYQAIELSFEQLPGFMLQLKRGYYIGGNVTLPYKEAVIPFVDKLTASARAIGAVNFLYRENDKLIGDNSDSYGFVSYLDHSLKTNSEIKQAMILGAGGAARAVLYGLLQRPMLRLYIANRSMERAVNLARFFSEQAVCRQLKPGYPKAEIKAIKLEQASEFLGECDLLINALAHNLTLADNLAAEKINQDGLGIGLDFKRAKSSLICYDLTYRPVATKFLQIAKAHGLFTIDGLGMLIYQAQPCFAKCYGLVPQIDHNLFALLQAKAI